MILDVVINLIFNNPFDEVQLCQGRMNFMRCTGNCVRKLLRSTKWIKEFLRVPIQTGFVRVVYSKDLTITRLVGCMVLLRVIRNEPLKISQ